MSLSITEKRRVAIAYDGSEDAKKLFDWTVKNIIRPESDHIILLAAVNRGDKNSLFSKKEPVATTTTTAASTTITTEGDLPMLSTTLSNTDKAIEKVEGLPQSNTARERLEQMSDSLHKLSISSEVHVLWGDAKTLIPRYTIANKVDLLVVGSRGLGAVKSVFLGSVSDACLKECPCPVLVVRNTTI